MNAKNYKTAILDADITGPSIPKAFGLGDDGVGMTPTGPHDPGNRPWALKSALAILDHETDPVIWRGPVIAGAVKQFWQEALWEDIDYMFVDMPPGTE